MQLGKVTREEVEKELMLAGVTLEAVKGIVEVLSLKSLEMLEGLFYRTFNFNAVVLC